jgi:uncharacterized protein (TIGR02118 family)
MVKLIIFFRKPANTDVFEDQFNNHVQLMNQLPNLRRTAVNRAVGAPRGEPPYFLIHEIFFDDMAAANYALNSPQGRAAGADLMAFARDTANLMFAEVWGEEPPPPPAPAAPTPEPADVAVAQTAVAAAAVAEASAAPDTPKPYTIDDIIAMNQPTETVAEGNDPTAPNRDNG